jgi:hypothetical protein
MKNEDFYLFKEQSSNLLRCIRINDLEQYNITQSEVSKHSNVDQRTVSRIEGNESTTWHAMHNIFYYYCTFEGIKEKYGDAFKKLYMTDYIPEDVLRQLKDENSARSEIEEEFREIYDEALEICKINYHALHK